MLDEDFWVRHGSPEDIKLFTEVKRIIDEWDHEARTKPDHSNTIYD